MTATADFQFGCDFCTIITAVKSTLDIGEPFEIKLPLGWRTVSTNVGGAEGPRRLICPNHADSSFEPTEVLR